MVYMKATLAGIGSVTLVCILTLVMMFWNRKTIGVRVAQHFTLNKPLVLAGLPCSLRPGILLDCKTITDSHTVRSYRSLFIWGEEFSPFIVLAGSLMQN
jgi:hypothetical protein